jgi:hypothetical protein
LTSPACLPKSAVAPRRKLFYRLHKAIGAFECTFPSLFPVIDLVLFALGPMPRLAGAVRKSRDQ